MLAWPPAYYAGTRWLQSFAYRAGINIWIFIFASISALVIALMTITLQSLRALQVDPAKTLRRE